MCEYFFLLFFLFFVQLCKERVRDWVSFVCVCVCVIGNFCIEMCGLLLFSCVFVQICNERTRDGFFKVFSSFCPTL